MEHSLADEQYVDSAEVKFVEVGKSGKAFSGRMLSCIEL